MRYVAAYLLASLGGSNAPSADDIKKILGSVGIDAEDDALNKVISELSGKNLEELIAAGHAKLASVPSGGGAVAASSGGGGGDAGPPGSKCFVGQLPFSKSEGDLWQLFGAIGPVAEVLLLKDKRTNEKKGAAFVRFNSAQNANQAVAALDGFTFAGSPRPISVSLAQSDGGVGGEKRSWATAQNSAAAKIMSLGTQAEGALDLGGLDPGGLDHGGGHSFAAPQMEPQEGAKLFVGQLPFSRSEEEIKQVFGSYGPVAEVFLHRDSHTGQKKGGAFVRFFTVDDAYRALELDGYVFQGATRPITVALAGEGGAKRQRIV